MYLMLETCLCSDVENRRRIPTLKKEFGKLLRYVELYQGIIKPFEQGNKVQQVVNKSVCHFLRVALSATIIAKLALSSEFVSEVRLFKRSSIPTACLIYSLDDNFELPVCKGVDELVGHLPSEL
ncbi:hypothetical protein M514_04529 [Trichuris suis]|uniref:Uncharacterized protein n=1 Tax=Trichuris suis TaxID=68888 RepID=A0A085NIH2_9BILA|nr:hypothetical protein M514_04529 [Trichuris suis]